MVVLLISSYPVTTFIAEGVDQTIYGAASDSGLRSTEASDYHFSMPGYAEELRDRLELRQ